MAEAAAEHRCSFEWNLFNPFLLSRSLQAVFYQGSPTVTQWKVTFQPLDRGINNNLNFAVSLETLESFAHRLEMVADRILVHIVLNGECISRRETTYYHFNKTNRYRYHLQENGTMHSEMETHHLVIKIEISLPGRAIEKLGNGHYSSDSSLLSLKVDLDRILSTPQYSNMILKSRNDPKSIQVHSYMIEARWDNFFKWHAFDVNTRNTVTVDITYDLLKDILNYMYTTELCANWPDKANPAYVAELFQVINRYELYHLYKVFVKSDLQQVHVTRNPMLNERLLFPLDSFKGRPINNASRTFFIEQKPEYAIVFQTRVRQEAGNVLSYSLRSDSSCRVYVQVNMELVKREGGNDLLERVYSFHEESYTMDPKESVQSRGIILLGQFTMFGDSTLLSADGAEIEYYIRCVLNVTNATVANQVRSADDTVQTNEVRLGVLSDHMYKLRKRKFDTDMIVFSSSEGLGFCEDECRDRIHKEILASRISDWWEGLENVQQVNRIPDNARFTLDSSTLQFVLDYMYTGRAFSLPFSTIDGVLGFAIQTTFNSLFEFVLTSIPLDVSIGYFDIRD